MRDLGTNLAWGKQDYRGKNHCFQGAGVNIEHPPLPRIVKNVFEKKFFFKLKFFHFLPKLRRSYFLLKESFN